jgi:hypothetical protein
MSLLGGPPNKTLRLVSRKMFYRALLFTLCTRARGSTCSQPAMRAIWAYRLGYAIMDSIPPLRSGGQLSFSIRR